MVHARMTEHHIGMGVWVRPMTAFDQMKRQVVESHGDGWRVGADGVIVCPCGRRIEDDGQCPDGHVSPLRQKGLI